MTNRINITIIDYPNALQSAVQGLRELFLLANKIILENELDTQFNIGIATPQQAVEKPHQSDIIILPPNLDGDYFKQPEAELLSYLKDSHRLGAIICSACAGAFILAETGLLDNRAATTHWQLADDFTERYPNISLKVERLLVNDGDIISAGGLMSWIDLGLEIVAQVTKPHIMRSLGKFLIVDTGKREQRYYGSFRPKSSHGNEKILQVQHHIQAHYDQSLSTSTLAALVHITDRTFLRQFTSATDFKPSQYIQKIRVQKACEMLESGTNSFEQIALAIGYDDANSCRKTFIKIMGLSPSAFRTRFA